MPETNQINLTYQPKQKILLKTILHSEYEWIGYGGARGGAKSHAIRDIAIDLGLNYGVYSLIFRRYSQELLDNHINPMFSRYPFLRDYFNKSERILYSPINGDPMVRFGYAESIDDVYKFQGTEYPVIFIDEATQSTQEMIEWLSTSNRDSRGVLPSKAKMVLTMNPGGVSHPYIKRIFVDKVYVQNESPADYYFIQAHVWDNVMWSKRELKERGVSVNDYYKKWTEEQRKEFTIKHSSYAKRLSKLPPQLQKAYLYGDWNVFAGMFWKDFDASKEVIKPFPIPSEWKIAGSLDPGFSSPLSFGLTAKSPQGNIYRIATYYNIDSIPRHAKAIRKWLTDKESPIYPYLEGRLPDYTVAGRDAFSKLDKSAIVSNEETIENYFVREGLHLLPANDGSGTRLQNWWTWKGLMPDRYFVFDKLNEPLIMQLTSTMSDERIVEDIQGRGNDPNVEDHALDDQKLAIASLWTPVIEVVEKDSNAIARSFVVGKEDFGDYKF